MVTNIHFIGNDHVQVAYDYAVGLVAIYKAGQTNGLPQRTYAGIDGLKEKFDELVRGFNEEYDVAFCIDYFKPSFNHTIINS